MRKIESYLPVFQGFYGTSFESDMAEENTLHNLDEDGIEIKDDRDIEWDYEEYRNRVGKTAVGSVENYLKHDGLSIGIEFEKIYSPRFYNFENDSIYCTYSVTDEDFAKLIEYCESHHTAFKEFLLDNYASRSGFSSFFDTMPQTWFDEYLEEGSNKFERAFVGILEFYLQEEGYTVDDMLSDCQEDCGYIDYKLLN
jgi:hypothetical protein